jgi:4-hydroxy-2-oxoheptanedioate aldolase
MDYIAKADVWPLNPSGELILGLKVEDKYAVEHVDASLSVPGIAFAEWGPGDMALSYGMPDGSSRNPLPPQLAQARAKVLAACKKHKIYFLNTVKPTDVVAMIQEGVMIGAGGQEAAEVGRKHTRRQMPW